MVDLKPWDDSAEFGALTDQQLVDTWEESDDIVRHHSDRRDRIGMWISQRLEERQAREMTGTGLVLALKRGTPEYDRGRLLGLKELVTQAEWAAAFEPEHVETVEVAWKLNQSRINQWARAYGQPVRDFLASVQLPGKAGRLVRKAGKK